jgi:GntR family transcriptional regulator/MocR family aminotransferase
VVVNGSQQAIDLAARVLLDAGDAVVIEEPGFEGARHAFRTAGARIVPGLVDTDGLDPAVLAGDGGRARLLHVTPSHQYPLGGVMPYPRRVAVLEWAARAQAWVLEDDYDGEYRYAGRPVEALKSLDDGDRVLYVGTFSKVMFPALRIGYLVLPPALVEPFVRAKALVDGGSPVLEQDALADFIASGEFERHVRRSRVRSGARRATLLDALARELGDAVEIAGANAGLHVVAWLRDVALGDLRTVVRRAAAAGVGVYPVTPHYVTPPKRAGLLLGYASLPERDIRAGVAKLGEVLTRER